MQARIYSANHEDIQEAQQPKEGLSPPETLACNLSGAVQSAARDKADLAAEELRDALLPLGLGAALRQAARDAALGGAVDVQRRRQAACTRDSRVKVSADRGGGQVSLHQPQMPLWLAVWLYGGARDNQQQHCKVPI